MNNRPIVCITGGTRGLGFSMVHRFISQGAVVVACGRSVGVINELSNEFEAPHLFMPVDVTNEQQVQAFAEQVNERLGPPDFLINNAGIINCNAPLWEISADEFSKVLDVNVKGIANMIRSFLPLMLPKQRGVIVNFSSGWGRSTSADVAPYCASKFAVEGLSSALAQELPDGMAVVALNPGVINTQMLQSCFGANADDYPSAHEWVESAVPFILNLDATNNGESLTV